jgi:hypothetical protein
VLDSGETIVIPGNLASTPLSSHHNIDDGQVRRTTDPLCCCCFCCVCSIIGGDAQIRPRKEKEKHPGRVENRKKIDLKWRENIYPPERERSEKMRDGLS